MAKNGINNTVQDVSGWLRKAWRKNGAIVLMYVASALGALSRLAFDALVTGGDFYVSTKTVVLACIVSGVTFPLIYQIAQKTHETLGKPSLLLYFIAYGSGFFWQSLLATIIPRPFDLIGWVTQTRSS